MKQLLTIFIITASFNSFSKAVKYKGGDSWTKYKVNKEKYLTESFSIQDTVLRTAKVLNHRKSSVGTSFLIKETDNYFVFLTNYHVLSNQKECNKTELLIKDSGFKSHTLDCSQILQKGSIASGSDYTYFSVKKTNSNSFLSQLSELKVINANPPLGTELAIVGFAGGKFSKRVYDISISQDDDCVFLLGNRNISLSGKLVRDTIFTGCDIAQGDSGSAILNRFSGELVGLFFGSAVQSRKNSLSSREIHKNIGTAYSKFVTHSSYGIDIRTIPLREVK
jgi:hypothetical protein